VHPRALFLRSAVARRVFGVLLVAALVPLLAFGAVAVYTFTAHAAADERRASNDYLKFLSLRLYDRIGAAQAALVAHASMADATTPAPQAAPLPSVLSRVAVLPAAAEDGPSTRLAAGDPGLLQAWRTVTASGDTPGRQLWWLPQEGVSPARVILSYRHPDTGARWLAELASDHLWSDFLPGGPASQACVTDVQGLALFCPAQGVADRGFRPLFMAGGFGSPDWRVGGVPTPSSESASWVEGKLLALAGAATLVLVVLLGLVMVRRTMVPLERLTAGTRQLAAGDWAARVALVRSDEFGQLAESFNTMAGRIGRQMQALRVQNDIDREILGELDLGRVMLRVARRLQELAPQARVAVLARDGTGRAWHVYRPGEATAVAARIDDQALTVPPDGLAVHCSHGDDLPSWARVALQLPAGAAAVCWVPVWWQGELMALMLLGCAQGLALDQDAHSEVEELRDRLSVMLAAAQRNRRLNEMALRDSLTGLLNRNGLIEACDHLLGTEGAAPACALLYIDLDGFKEVNDSMGHAAGDDILRQVSDRLTAALLPGATLARPGGDEFVVLLPGEADAAQGLASLLCRQLAQPFVTRGEMVYIGASCGIACCPGDATERDELMRRADIALYAAKADGRGHWRRFAGAMDAQASERAWILRDLRKALDAGELLVHYQPRLDARTGRVCSTEALVRWPHAVHGMVSPARFIPVAEECGLIERLGQHVFEVALAQKRLWNQGGLPVGRVAINVSAVQLRDPQFATRILAQLQTHGLQPQDLEVELTESLFAGDAAFVARAIEPLRRCGVTVALDDFGTGYSSLSALQTLPIDVLKIDRSFVMTLGQGPQSEAVVQAVIQLAGALGKHTVAEGVETRLQQQRLASLGCDELQGFRFARPMAAAAFEQCVAKGFDLSLPDEELARASEPAAAPPVEAAAQALGGTAAPRTHGVVVQA